MKISLNVLNNKLYKTGLNSPKIVFRGFDCSEDNFELKRLYDIPCPICSIPMIQKNQIDSFVNSALNKKGAELIKILNKYQKYYHDTEREVINILIQEASNNNSANVLTLANDYLKRTLPLIEERQICALEKIKKLLISQKETNKASILELINENIDIINSHGDRKFVKKQFLANLEKCARSSHEAKKIFKLANKVPDDNEGAVMFLIKYKDKTQAEFLSRLLTPSLATCEHIRPKSQGGLNNT